MQGATKGNKVGASMTWLSGGALAVCLILVAALLGLIAWKGLGYFWPKPLTRIEMADGRLFLGEIQAREEMPAQEGWADADKLYRIKIKTGNRSLSQPTEFHWLDEEGIKLRSEPLDAVHMERNEWGNYHGRMVEIRRGEEVVASGSDACWKAWGDLAELKEEQRDAVHDFLDGAMADINHEMVQLRLERRAVGLEVEGAEARDQAEARIDAKLKTLQGRYDELEQRLVVLRDDLNAEMVVLEDVNGKRTEMPLGEVLQAVRPNALSGWDAAMLFVTRVWRFVSDEPRESNTEGGVAPAIFGTVMMVFIMSFAVVPFGVLAALYLREYARQGPVVRLVRIAVNNLAGTPSIVFGVFGLGFFVYFVGGSLDQLFYPEALPRATFGTGGILWASLTLALLTVPVVIVATEEGLAAVPKAVRQGSLALGATKWETLRKVVIPASTPAILTGMILAMARAAGEVAPLMIVGMVKHAPDLPIDRYAPFVHLERKFMHLGFHIYDVGYQSPNVEAVKPLLFATALLLVFIVVALNMVAIVVRNRLRKKYASSQV